jgi:hypothetical protein
VDLWSGKECDPLPLILTPLPHEFLSHTLA